MEVVVGLVENITHGYDDVNVVVMSFLEMVVSMVKGGEGNFKDGRTCVYVGWWSTVGVMVCRVVTHSGSRCVVLT